MPINVELKSCTLCDLANLVTILVAVEVQRCGVREFNRMLEESDLTNKVKVKVTKES